MLIEFGYLAIPVAIGAVYLFDYAVPAILVGMLPISMFSLRVTETLTIGPGLDMVPILILVSMLTVYVRDANFLANPIRCHDCARDVLSLAVLYSAIPPLPYSSTAARR